MARRGKEDQAKDVPNFFITEFLEKFRAKEFYEIFKDYERVVELVVPSKRVKRGRRYGFVRFRKVSNDRVLVTKLDNIFIRGRKLYVNIPISTDRIVICVGGSVMDLSARKNIVNYPRGCERIHLVSKGGRSYAKVVKENVEVRVRKKKLMG